MEKGRIWLSDCYWEENREMRPLPEELLRKFLANKCLICDVTIATLSAALVHYESDDHVANATNYIRYNYNLTGKIVHPKDSFPPTLCEPCNVSSVNRSMHLQHVSGIRHAKKMKSLQAAGEAHFPMGISGAAQQRIEMEDSPGRRSKVSSPLRSGEYVCSLCDVISVNKSQMEIHNKGQKHQKKVSKLPAGELKDFFMRKGNCEPVSVRFSINSTGDSETKFEGTSNYNQPASDVKERMSADNSMASVDVRSPDSTLPVSGLTQCVPTVGIPATQSAESLQVNPELVNQDPKKTDSSACASSTEVSSSSMVNVLQDSSPGCPQTEVSQTSSPERSQDNDSSISGNGPSPKTALVSNAEMGNSDNPSANLLDEKANEADTVEVVGAVENNEFGKIMPEPSVNKETDAAASSNKPIATACESFATASEPVSELSEPTAVLNEPVEALSEPVPATNESVPETDEPDPATNEPVPALSESISAPNEPASTAPALGDPVDSLGEFVAATVDASDSLGTPPLNDSSKSVVISEAASTNDLEPDAGVLPETPPAEKEDPVKSINLDDEPPARCELQLEPEQQKSSPPKPKLNSQASEKNSRKVDDIELDKGEPGNKSEVSSTETTTIACQKSVKKTSGEPKIMNNGNKNSVAPKSEAQPTDVPTSTETPKPKEKKVIVIESSNSDMEPSPNSASSDKSKIQSLRKAFADSEKEKVSTPVSKTQENNVSQRRVIVISKSSDKPAPKPRLKSRFSSPRRDKASSPRRDKVSSPRRDKASSPQRDKASSVEKGKSSSSSKPAIKSAVRTTTKSRENPRLNPSRSSSTSSEKSRGRSLGKTPKRADSGENRSSNRNRRGSSNSSHRSRSPSPSKRRSDDANQSSSDYYSSPTKGNFPRFNQGNQNNWNRQQNRPWRGGGQWFRPFNPRFNNMRFNQPPWQGPGGPGGPGGMGPGGPGGMGPGGMGPGPGVMGPGPGGPRMPGYWNNVPCFQGPRNMGPWFHQDQSAPPQSYWNMRPQMPTYWNPGIPSPEPQIEVSPPREEKKYPIRRVCSDDSVEEGEVDDSGRECGIDRFGREKRDDETADRRDVSDRESRKKKRKRKREKKSRSSSPDSRSRSARRYLEKKKKVSDKKEPRKTDLSMPVDSEKIKQRLLACHNQQSSRTMRKSETLEDQRPARAPQVAATKVPPPRGRDSSTRAMPEVDKKESSRKTAGSIERVPSTSRRVPDSSGRLQENPDSMRTAEELKQKQLNEILMQVAVLKRRLLDAEEEKKRLLKKQKRKKKSKKRKRSSSSSSSSSTSSSSDSSSSESTDSPDDVKSLLAKISDDSDKRKKDKKKAKKKKKKSKKDEKKKKHDELLHSDSLLVSLEQFKTPDGTFQCKPCNMILASHKEFLAHITSEEHKKLCELIKRKLAE